MTAQMLLSILLRGAALSVVTLAGVVALRRASAAHRHLAWTAGAIALLLLPIAAWTLPELDVAVLPAPEPVRRRAVEPVTTQVASFLVRAASTDAETTFVPEDPSADPATTAAAAVAPSPPAAPSPLVLAWIAGAVLVALRLAFGAAAAHRLVAHSDAVADARVLDAARDAARRLGRGAPPPLRTTRDVDSPLTIGALRPHVILPVEALAWPADRLRLALLHEFAHVRRRDLLSELTARLAVVVHWPNPLAWFAVSRLRIERERASDDLVLAAGHGADEYASFLVSLARALRRTPPPVAVAATMAGGPQFERRVRAILDARQRRIAPSPRMRVLFALLAASSLSFAACVRPTTAAAGDEEHRIVTVAVDGSGQFTSIAAALDAAPAGAVIRVGPGTFDEHVSVTKAVTIEGAGADRTTIVADGPSPTLAVKGARDVVVRGMTITQRGAHTEGAVASCSVVELAECGARIENAAIAGGPGSGVVVGQGADVTIDGCLVAAAWGTGVAVRAAGEHPSAVRIANSDVRNCVYAGVTIGKGNRDVTIERCRISGASWHGIRYDDAAPTVKGNLIFENVRSGIYASGKTDGHVEGNLFFRNGLGDVSCWFEAKDVIEGNTFARSPGEAIAILGASAPVVRKNVFVDCKAAVMGGGIDDQRSANSQFAGGGTIEGNFVWRAGANFRRPASSGSGMTDAPLPPGNVVADPGFADAERRNYALSENSAARAAGAGVASPLSFASPWPPRPEETATSPRETPPSAAAPVSESPAPKAATGPPADLAGAKADVLQINDAAQRERGLAAIGAAIASADPNVARPALASLYELRDVKYDKRRFRADVVRQLGNADADVQTAASYALLQVEREPGDANLVLAAAEAKPVAPGGLLYVAMLLNKNRVEGRLADAFVKALAVDDPRRGAMDTANYLRGMWVAPAVEDAVVAAWRRYVSAGHERLLWPYILGQMQPAPRESRVRAVFEMMAGGDDGVRQLAGGVVTRPVDESARPLAAQLAAAGLATAPTSSLRRTYLDAIQANGGREQVAVLRALAANEMVGDELRALAGKVADELERR